MPSWKKVITSGSDAQLRTGSFGRIEADSYNISNPLESLTITGNISGSTSSTGSFGHFIVDGSGPAVLNVAGSITSSGAINTLSHITASGNISASGTSHVFGNVEINYVVDESEATIAVDSAGAIGNNALHLNVDGLNKISMRKDHLSTIVRSDMVIGAPQDTSTGTITFTSASGNITTAGILDITNTTDSSNDSGDTGALRVEGGASIAKKLYVGTNLDVDGTTNLDQTTIDGTTQINADVTITEEEIGGDLKVFGQGANKFLFWESGEDKLIVNGELSASGDLFVNNITASNQILVSKTLTVGDDIHLPVGQSLKWGYAGLDFRLRGHSTGLLAYSGSNAQHNLLDQNTGNVSLGTSTASPNDKLTVSGSISSSGTITSEKLNVNPKNSTTPNMALGHWNIGYGSDGTEFTGSLTSFGHGYGEIVHFGNGVTIAGRVYCLKSDLTWELAQATGPVSSSLLGVAMGTHASSSGVLLRGVVRANAHNTLVVGQKVYNEAAGRVAPAPGADSDDVVRVLGHCVGQTSHIYFNPDNTWVEIA